MVFLCLKGGCKIKRSCKYCGKIHEEDFKCSKKPIYKKKTDEIVRFRNSPKWQNKRKQIKKRDSYLCQICIRNLYNTVRQYNADQLEVHHAISIKDDKRSKLDSNNLITLCSYHHEMCEKGKIPYCEVKKIIEEQEAKKDKSPLVYFD